MPALAQSGEGPAIGTQLRDGLTLGGYATVELDVPRGSTPAIGANGVADIHRNAADAPPAARSQATGRTTLALSHLSAILWWEPSPQWKLLAEVDSQHGLQIPAHDEGRDRPDSGATLALERIYADWRASDALTWRVGKFLTPIGRWNQDHPDPLTWTTSRPLLSRSAFPANATGVMAFGSTSLGLSDVDYQIYVAPGQNWRAGAAQDAFSRAVGARVVLPLGSDAQLGISIAGFNQRDEDTDHRRLGGLDLLWQLGRLQVHAEVLSRRGGDGYESSEHGGFVQLVHPLGAGWSGVLRVEKLEYESRPALHSTVLGVVFKGHRHWVFKAEYDRTSTDSPDLPSGWQLSVTGLF
ncbi:hypothetical protein ACG04R_05990 [Roseateles sp. BYS78W]|uniref:DUF2219 domain-containing protein n=1 Tax=Pelomonas candidula TaxID=3299025 RepID=A0ABW7H8H5_9BURK